MIMPTDVQGFWQSERWPCASGIYLRDNTVILMECVLEFWVRPIAKSTLASVVEFAGEFYTELTETFDWSSPGNVNEVHCGEASNGSEGFVALFQEGSVQWLAFFMNSNPFVRAWIDDETVSAVSNYGHIWRFPIDNPERVTVEWRPIDEGRV